MFIAACSVGGGEDDVTPTEIADAIPPSATGAVAPSATPEPTGTATATSTSTSTSTPEPTATPSPTPTRTPTPTATPFPEIENPFANLPQPDQVLENFTLSYTGAFGTPDGGTESIEIFIEQSSPTRYHLRTGAGVEIWVVEDATYFRNPDGSVFQIQSAVDPVLISPAAYLIQIPNPVDVPSALEIGEDEVEGRPATHYRVDADQVHQFGLDAERTVADPEGQIDVWIDRELGFVSRLDMDVNWTDENGQAQSAVADLTVSAIGTTAEVQPPI
jgi:hypothetical protein